MGNSPQPFLNTWLKWGTIIVLCIIYFVTYKDTVSEKLNEKLQAIEEERTEEAPSDVVIPKITIVEEGSAANERSMVNGMVQSMVNRMSQTEGGKRILQSLSEKASEEAQLANQLVEYGKSSRHDVAYFDVIRGTGARVTCGAKVTYDYHGYLPGQIKFDSSYLPEHRPVTVDIGKKHIIPGLEQGILTMQEGGRRKISVPPSLGYNVPGFENVEAVKNKILLYDVELRKVENGVEPVPVEMPAYTLTVLLSGNQRNIADCAERVTLEYTLTPDDKKTPWKRASVKLGEHHVARGLEEALIGLHVGGLYRLTLPTYWQQSLKTGSDLQQEIIAQQQKNVTLEFKILSIN